MYKVFEIHASWRMYQKCILFFLLSGVQLYEYATVYPIHSSVDGLLGCFQIWAITNKAAMNDDVQVFV